MLVFLCKCNNCDLLLIDTNSQIEAQTFEIKDVKLPELKEGKCPDCGTDDYLKDVCAC